MAQLDIFLDEQDVVELVESLIARSCYFVPDLHYSCPSIEEWKIETAEQFLTCRVQKRASLFFALSPEFVRCPLEFLSFEKEGTKRFFINQKSGGPTLDLFLPPRFAENGVPHLSSGFVGYHAKYWNTVTKTMEASPGSLKTLFAEISREMRKRGELKQATRRTYIVGPHTLNAARAGLVLTNPAVK